jgi:hypothetical protein
LKKGINALEFESVRELSISCKKQGINLGKLASSIRINNYTDKLGANLDQIESFIRNLANSPEPEKLFDVANQIAQISMSESIPIDILADHIKRQQEEPVVQAINEIFHPPPNNNNPNAESLHPPSSPSSFPHKEEHI